MNIFKQYGGLRRELYILFWGRVVTNMGALVWPMMTLMLKNKLGYTAGQASLLIIIVGFFMLPATLIGGKLADRVNKKLLIVVCDMVTVTGYIVCGFLPMSNLVILILSLSGIFAQMEWPAYDALVANLSSPEERERAFSLNYLGGNLGLVLAPTLGGILFENYLNIAFIISGLATFSSTVLIFFFVKDISPSKSQEHGGSYENEQSGKGAAQLFKESPVLILFVLLMGISSAIYAVSFNFLMPLGMDENFGSRGALLFGTLTSCNALTVIAGTPVLTSLLKNMRDAAKLQLGSFLQILGFGLFASGGKQLPLYYISVLIFTLGEILLSLGHQPYISRRIPSSHRGRMSSAATVVQGLLAGIFLLLAGQGADVLPLYAIWLLIIFTGGINVLLFFKLRRDDKKQFKLLYK